MADTHPDFAVMLYACQYAGLVPVPLPAAVHLGGREVYIRHLRKLMRDCEAVAAFAPPDFIGFLREATDGLPLTLSGTMDEFMALDAADELPPPPSSEELAYLQYTSGSTRFPRGTMITQAAVMANLKAIFNHGFQLGADDRFCSWLPYYHDMGLVGIVLGCVATQRSVDYLPTRDFAMRPRLWLTLISRNRCTVSFSPPFGYTLCARRLRPGDAEALDLSAWRVAGVGAEMIHPESLERFAEILAPAGFKASSFLPCYGMAECSLAVSFAPLERGACSDWIDIETLSREGVAQPVAAARRRQGQGLHQLRRAAARLRGRDPRRSGPGPARAALRPDLPARPEPDVGLLRQRRGLARGAVRRRLARHRRPRLRGRRRAAPHRPGQGPDDHQGPQHLAAGPRAPGRAAARSPADRLVGVLDHRRRRRGDGGARGPDAARADPNKLALLADRLQEKIHAEFGIQCLIELVTPHTLPRTSSGKLSRSSARKEFVERRRHDDDESPTCFITDETLFRPVARAAAPELALTAGG